MFKGFYDLTSGMLTQTRNLDIISNNMSNTSTIGYKQDRYADSTFQEVMLTRIGNKEKQKGTEELGTTTSHMTVITESRTSHKQGALEESALTLDFALDGENNYFAVEGVNGRVYTRNGSFRLDEQGYLYLPTQGRVLNQQGQPIYLGTDYINADNTFGGIYTANGQLLGQLGVFRFDNPSEQLEKVGEGGVFQTDEQPQAGNALVRWKMVERSNIDLVQQMVDMITCQHALTSSSRISQMYDQLMNRVATDLGRV